MGTFRGTTVILASLLFVAVSLLVLTYALSRSSTTEVSAVRRQSLQSIKSRPMPDEVEERSIGLGCVRLPKGNHGRYTVDVDWSHGHILLPDGTRIDFAVGLVEPIAIPEKRANFSWFRAERRSDGVLYYSAEGTSAGTVLTASIPRSVFSANFITKQSGPESLSQLLMIARSYSPEACP